MDAVVIEVGELTAVVPEFMYDGYEIISDEFEVLKGSELIIGTIEGIGECLDCGCEYRVKEHMGICPECGSSHREIVQGLEYVIKEIRVYE